MNNRATLDRLARRIRTRPPRARAVAPEQAIVFTGLDSLAIPELGVEAYDGRGVVELARRPGLASFHLLRLDVRDWVEDAHSAEQRAIVDRAPDLNPRLAPPVPTLYCLVPLVRGIDDLAMKLCHAVRWVQQARDASAPVTVHCRLPDGRLGYRCGDVSAPVLGMDGGPLPDPIRAGLGRHRPTDCAPADAASVADLLWFGAQHLDPRQPYLWRGQRPANSHKWAGVWGVMLDALEARDEWEVPVPPGVIEELARLPEPARWTLNDDGDVIWGEPRPDAD